MSGRLIGTRIVWKDPPPSSALIRTHVIVMKLGRGRCSGQTGTRVRGVSAVALGAHRCHTARAMDWEGNDHYCDVALAGMIVYENNLRNIMASAAVNNAKACVDVIVIIESYSGMELSKLKRRVQLNCRVKRCGVIKHGQISIIRHIRTRQ